MRFLDDSEKLMILISISDRLWEDYKNGDLLEKDYLKKSDEIRNEIIRSNSLTFLDLQSLTLKVGYVLVKNKNAFSTINNYTIARN